MKNKSKRKNYSRFCCVIFCDKSDRFVASVSFDFKEDRIIYKISNNNPEQVVKISKINDNKGYVFTGIDLGQELKEMKIDIPFKVKNKRTLNESFFHWYVNQNIIILV